MGRVTTYRGPAGDHNDRAAAAVVELGEALGREVGQTPLLIGTPTPADPTDWAGELARCRESLRAVGERVGEVLSTGHVPVTAMPRCAVALGTQPRVLQHWPETVVVWFDAHGDLNVPEDTTTGYLGGMALSGPLGWWDSGLGAGLPDDHAILVGARDLDPAEQAHVAAGRVALVPGGASLPDRLAAAIDGRPVYLHVDCDVLDPGLVATDYRVPQGLSIEELHACAEMLADGDLVGIEIGEYEGPAALDATDLARALSPVLRR